MPEAEIRASHGANLVPCRITRLQLVGHILQIGMVLPNGEAVTLEGHADKYRDTLSAGSEAVVAWNPSDATLIVQ
jgi:putative spermidine/putrescine transport system ATP-binding protein/spermidine/putrescine transport system ATP-binding protein